MADDPLLITGSQSSTPPTPKPPLSAVFVGPKTPPPAAPKPPEDSLPRLRTYAADLSEEIRERGATLSSIVTAEQAKVSQVAADPERNREGHHTFIIAAVALFLIILGVASVTAAIVFRKKSEPILVTMSIIFPNRTVSIDTTKGPLAALLTSLRENENPSLGEVERVNILAAGIPIAPQGLASALGVPEALAREVTDAMVGIHAFDRNQPFVIFRVSAYDRTFNAALKAESNMARSLGAFFAPGGQIPKGGPPTLVFRDAVIGNLDIRKSQDAWPIMYAFPTQGLMVITTNEYTLREVLARLGVSR
jgi:hypothetical protein